MATFLIMAVIALLSIVAVFKYRFRALLFAPVFLVVFDVLYGFFPAGSGFGSIRNYLFLLFILYLLVIRKEIILHNIWMSSFLIYTLFLLPFSSAPDKSFVEYMCVFSSMLCLPAGFYFIRNITDLKLLNLFMLVAAFVFVLNSIFSAIFGFGISAYGGTFTLGGFIGSKLFTPALFIVLLPVILPLMDQKMRIISIVVASLTLIFLILSMRRTSVFIPVFGYLVYFFLSKRKFQFVFAAMVFVAMLLALFPLYQNILEQQFQARMDTFENPSLEREYRYKETFIVINETLSNLKTSLVGKEVFNSSGNYNNGLWGVRPIHMDFNAVLHGSGLIGLFLYALFFFDVAFKFIRYRGSVPDDPYLQEVVIMFQILFVLLFLVSFNGGMSQTSYRAVILLYLGGFLGIMNKYHNHFLYNPLTKQPGE